MIDDFFERVGAVVVEIRRGVSSIPRSPGTSNLFQSSKGAARPPTCPVCQGATRIGARSEDLLAFELDDPSGEDRVFRQHNIVQSGHSGPAVSGHGLKAKAGVWGGRGHWVRMSW